MRSILLLMSLAAVACAAPQQQTPSVRNPNGQVCTEEKTTGTNMSRTVCRDQTTTEDERNAARNWYSAPRPTPTVTK